MLTPFAWLAALAPALPAQETPAAADARPNVILLLADDLGRGDLSCYGGWIPTPHIDALAAGGARFGQAYAPAPVCTPSRAGLMTGLYPARLGVQCNTGANAVARKKGAGMPGEVVTLPERLHGLGVHSGLIGKWHLGMKAELRPTAQGFDEFFGFLGPHHAYLPSTPDARMLRGDESEAAPESEYLTDALAREAAAFLGENRARPFFLCVAFNAPHIPYEARPDDLARFPDLKGQKRTYAAIVSALDDAVGRITARLDELGLSERTLLVFASDNGAAIDAADPSGKAPGSNGEFAQGKGTLFEGGVRVPLLARWPGRIEPGRVVDAPVSLLDVDATAYELAGATPEALAELDGRSLLATLAASAPAERTFLWKLGPGAAIRKGSWKLVQSKDSRWLFDLAADAREQHDLAAAQPERVQALAAELDAWVATLPPPAWANDALPEPLPVLGKPYWIEY